MKSMNLFAQIAKIDESKHEVWGVATAETVDKEGEIFDYDSSKPYFKLWSEEISKATDGKSLGNVREMHEPSAVGKLVAIAFDDDLKQIRVGARIVDSVAWQKCMLGVYTGFSIGGAYVKAWKDGEYVRFTANPVEISVVDNPCVPGAHFTAVKVDGTSEVRKFTAASGTQQAIKVGARHSKATLAHLDAIKTCMDKMAQGHEEASTHMDALLDSDDAATHATTSGIKKSRAIHAPEQRQEIKAQCWKQMTKRNWKRHGPAPHLRSPSWLKWSRKWPACAAKWRAITRRSSVR